MDIDIIRVFHKNFTFSKSINLGRTTIIKGTHASIMENSHLSSFSLMVMNILEEI